MGIKKNNCSSFLWASCSSLTPVEQRGAERRPEVYLGGPASCVNAIVLPRIREVLGTCKESPCMPGSPHRALKPQGLRVVRPTACRGGAETEDGADTIVFSLPTSSLIAKHPLTSWTCSPW